MIKHDNYKHADLTDIIIAAFYVVYNNLGFGFKEKVYENALLIELDKRNLEFAAQKNIKVYYQEQIIGNFVADIIVENTIILELKAVESIRAEHEVQVVNYLRATEIEIGLLLNFGKKPEVRRKVFSNMRKKNLKHHTKS